LALTTYHSLFFKTLTSFSQKFYYRRRAPVEQPAEMVGTPFSDRERFKTKVRDAVVQKLKEAGGNLDLKDVILGAVLSIPSPDGDGVNLKRVLATDRNPMFMLGLDSLATAQGSP